MPGQNIDKKLTIFRSLFKGREDVFALRWEIPARSSAGETKSGYMPAYVYDPYRYRAHKMKGGTFQSYADKTYLPLTNEQLIKHLNGEQFVGLYPLLQDNTSWFIAADFDEQNWIADSQNSLNVVGPKGYLLTWSVPGLERADMYGHFLVSLTQLPKAERYSYLY